MAAKKGAHQDSRIFDRRSYEFPCLFGVGSRFKVYWASGVGFKPFWKA